MFKPKPSPFDGTSQVQTSQQRFALAKLTELGFSPATTDSLLREAQAIAADFHAWQEKVSQLAGRPTKAFGQVEHIPQDLDIRLRMWMKNVIWGAESTIPGAIPIHRSWWLVETLEAGYTNGRPPVLQLYVPDMDAAGDTFVVHGFEALKIRIESAFEAFDGALPRPITFRFVVGVGVPVRSLKPVGEEWTSRRLIKADNSVFEGGEKKTEEEKRGGGGGNGSGSGSGGGGPPSGGPSKTGMMGFISKKFGK